MTTDDAPASLLLVRAWRHPDGPLCARVGAVTDPGTGPVSWELCVGQDQTLLVVSTWLGRWAPDPSVPPPAHDPAHRHLT